MPRTFPGDFAAKLDDQHTKPYLVLEVQWGDSAGTKYYLDRPSDSFSATGTRAPTVESSLVVDWGQISLTLKEQQVGAVDALTIKLEDRNGEVTRTLSGTSPRQRRVVKIWRMFDENDVTWSGDAGLVFMGTTKPHGWSEADNLITIEVEDPARLLTQSIDCLARASIFERVPPDYQDRNIPLAWGLAERVESVLVDRPWETKIGADLDLATWTGETFDVDEHPDDIKAPINTDVDVYIGQSPRPQAFRGKFHLSTNKATTPSTFEITGALSYQTFTRTITSVDDSGTDHALATISGSGLTDQELAILSIIVGKSVSIVQSSNTRMATVRGILDNGIGGFYIGFNEQNVSQALTSGQTITFYYQQPAADIDSLDSLVGGKRTVYFLQSTVVPSGFLEDLSQLVGTGTTMEVLQSGTYQPVTVDAIEADNPSSGTYMLRLSGDPAILAALAVDQTLRFPVLTNSTVNIGKGAFIWPITGNWVYAANALPSLLVMKVEGFGDTTDQAGNGRKDFILIGEKSVSYADDPSVGSVQYLSDRFTVNRNDSTWNLGTGLSDDLGRNITTVTFTRAPRMSYPQLENNRLWMTLKGVESSGSGGGTLVTNPALVILTYLEHAKLLNIDTSVIDEDSFTDAATTLNDRYVGFAQTEAVDGLEYIQELARQCRSIIFFDQGKVSIKVLKNSVASTDATFSEANMLEASLEVHETDIYDVATRLTANWRHQWDDHTKIRKVVAVNNGAELSVLGINAKEFDVWMYNARNFVETEIGFWLTRWSRIYREVMFTAFLEASKLQPGDWITLSYIQGATVSGSTATVSGSNVTITGYTFVSTDIGKLLTLSNVGGGTAGGSYTITAVAGSMATVSSAPGNGTADSWAVGGQQIIAPLHAEVLEVKDQGWSGLVSMKVRYVQYSF